MSHAQYFYFPLKVKDLETIVAAHQEAFEQFLGDTFSDDELAGHEEKLDEMAAPFVQPIFSELTFDDFNFDPELEKAQRFFFEECRSSICLENLPEFYSNPFQVSWLLQLLEKFSDVLIDPGGVEELVFKLPYVNELKKYKSVDSLISSPLEKPLEIKTKAPVFPIDFLILDVYQEIDRLKNKHIYYHAAEMVSKLPEKSQKVFEAMKEGRLDSSDLLRKSGLIAKDFGDNLERLKFFLKKL